LQLQVEGIRIDVRSLAGIATTVAFPDWSLCIDMGSLTSAALRCDVAAFTHGHSDHVAGLNQFLGVRRLYGMKPPRLLAPASLAPVLQRLVDVLGELQGRPFESVVEAVPPGGEVEIGRGLLVRPFPVVHSVPTFGWAVVRRVQKLRPEFVGLPGPRIERLKADPAAAIFEEIDSTRIAVTGDTQLQGLDLGHRDIQAAEVLMIETTFLDAERRDANAAKIGGHVHLDDLGDVLRQVQARAVVLYHVSQVYRPDEVAAAVEARVPPEWRGRVHVVVPGLEERL
jgi:ribonuclease Z